MSGKEDTEISIVIVNYKTPILLCNCIASIYEHKDRIKAEIIVVDNASGDDSGKMVKQRFNEVVWMNMGYNAGFGRANNLGIRYAKSPYVLLLNSDTLLTESCLTTVLEYYKNIERSERIGLLGCKMLDMENNVLFNSNKHFKGAVDIFIDNPIIRRIRRSDPNKIFTKKTETHSSDHISVWLGAAFVMFNKSMFIKKGLLFDETFFMYYEDVEWCYRIRKEGLKNYFMSFPYIYHINCGSSVDDEWKCKQLLLSELLYYRKTRGYLYYLLCVILFVVNNHYEMIFLFKDSLISGKKNITTIAKLKMMNKLIITNFKRILRGKEALTVSL